MAEKKLNGTVIVTYRCNARCSMCNRYKAPSKPEEEITIETIKELLDKTKEVLDENDVTSIKMIFNKIDMK